VPLLFPQSGVLLASGMYCPIQIDPKTMNVLVKFYSDSITLSAFALSPDDEIASDRYATSAAASLGASATSPGPESNIHPSAISEIAYSNGVVYVATLEGKVNAYDVEPTA